MQRIAYRIILIIGLSSVTFLGCAAGHSDEIRPDQKAALMKVRDEIIGENHSKAASDENGTEHDIAETDKKEIKKEAIGKEQIGEDDIEKTELQPVLYMDQEAYRSLVKKVWIEDWTERQYSDAFEFIITRIEAEKIEGVIVFGDDVASCYWSNIKKLQQRCRPFQGTIHGNQSVPEPGTKAVLYLPSQKEAEGRVVLATVKNLQNGIYNDTQKREFVTGCHKKLGLYPQKIFVENVDGSVTCSMDDNSDITIGSNTGISFLADGEISCTGRNITIMTPVKAVSRTAQSNIELCRDINLYAPEGVKTIGTGGKAGKHAEASVGKLLREPEMEHWQTSFSAIAAVPQMDLGQIGEAGDVIDIFANGSVPGMAGGSAVVAMSEVMAGKKESETSFPSVFKSMDNYTVKGGYKLPEE